MVANANIKIMCCGKSSALLEQKKLETGEDRAVFKCYKCGMIYTFDYFIRAKKGFGISVQSFETLPTKTV